MKKSKIYFLAPILALLAFIAYYWSFKSGYDAEQAAKVVHAKEARDAKLQAEQMEREKAIQDAIASQKERKKERDEREAKDRARVAERETALQARDKAEIEAEKAQRQSERLTKDIETAKQEIAKIEQDKDTNLAEEKFLADYITQTHANVQSLSAVLVQIAAADEANAKAAAAAATAAAIAAAKK